MCSSDWVKDLPRLFEVAIGEQLHRPLEIGEEHGHLLALTFPARL